MSAAVRMSELLCMFLFIVASMFCTTMVIFHLTQGDDFYNSPYFGVQRSINNSPVAKRASEFSPAAPIDRFEDVMPSFANNFDIVSDKVKDVFCRRMGQIGECQSQRSCSRRILIFNACTKQTCESVGVRLLGLAAAFYMAYSSHRFYHISWTRPSDLDEFFEVNADFCPTDLLTKETYNNLTSNLDDVAVKYYKKSSLPSEEDLQKVEVISIGLNAVAFLDKFLTKERYRNAREELFSFQNSHGDKQWVMDMTYDNLVAAALRLILSRPTARLKNFTYKVWRRMYEAVDPPRGRALVPGGRRYGNDGITRFGVYAAFGSGDRLLIHERSEPACFVKAIANLAVFYGMVSGIGGLFVGSNSKEARNVIMQGAQNTDFAAISLDLVEIFNELGSKTATTEYLHDLREIMELSLISRMDVIAFKPGPLASIAVAVARVKEGPADDESDKNNNNNNKVMAYFLMTKPSQNTTTQEVPQDNCKFEKMSG